MVQTMDAADSDFDSSFAGLFACGYRAAFRLVGCRPDAEDVAIEAVARAQARWGEVHAYGEAWVVRVATNLALDQLRRGAAPTGTSPSRATELAADQRVDLVRALRQLPRRQREVVLLRYIGDRSERDVAAVLGISAGSVKQHASRGLAALRTSLGGYGSEASPREVAEPPPDQRIVPIKEVDDVR